MPPHDVNFKTSLKEIPGATSTFLLCYYKVRALYLCRINCAVLCTCMAYYNLCVCTTIGLQAFTTASN
ncbi:uncharacterized protein EDB93DRAFT_1153555 [Suillus bovinus]|uniref:uncharacterized protein n=1 Tax=Suillus bovinus TaxID=48563 RepID=UPI001B87F1AA|nr:uncharacterized protein EDB93DRAFT_1153555 [Suillus bovinus]KAG2144098.1 hypothetical protein EDB93DRAFT_1153555 [Suillus bovinus]